MRLLKRLSALVFGLAMLLLVPSIARADDVTDWNQHMLRAGTVGATTPLMMSRVAAIVQASVFDAVNGIDRKYTPVHVPPGGPAGITRFPAQCSSATRMPGPARAASWRSPRRPDGSMTPSVPAPGRRPRPGTRTAYLPPAW